MAQSTKLVAVELSNLHGGTSNDECYDQLPAFRKIARITEILRLILDHLVPISNDLVPPKSRNSLSQESFAAFPPFPDIAQIGIFRLICAECSVVGIGPQFTRIVVRFSFAGLDRLQWLSERRHLAEHVKQFSYMIPHFYPQDSERFLYLLQQIDQPVDNLSNARNERREQDMELITSIMYESNDQRILVKEHLDVRLLRFAMKRFDRLQQIRLMRVENQLTTRWVRFLQRFPNYAEEFGPAPLTYAFMHAAQTLSAATKELKNPITRFSSRFMEPPLPLVLTPTICKRISESVGNLQYLEQEFRYDAGTLEDKVLGLAPLFLVIWNAAHNLIVLHVGFSHRLAIPLQAVFQNVHLTKLQHFGIHLWDLEEEELVEFLERHKDTLQSIRLRYISLRIGRWKNVLEHIRLRHRLKWISLRGIGYDAGPPNYGAMGFTPAPVTIGNLQYDSDANSSVDWDLGSSSEVEESSTEESDMEDDDSEGADDTGNSLGFSVDLSVDESVVEEREPLEEHESDIEEFHGVTFDDHPPPQEHFHTSSTCECANGYAFTDMDDNGLVVTPEQWKRWQKWCLHRCVIHDPI